MTTRPCNLCNVPRSVCPNHATDPNRPAQLFPGVDDPFPAGFQGFHSPVPRPDLGWLAGASPHQEEPQVHQSQTGFGYMDLLRSTCDPSKIPLDLSWSLEVSDEEASPSPSPSPQPPPPVNEIVPSSSTMPPFPWATFTTYSSETSKEAADNNSASTNGLEAQAVETATDREARVQRYKEKRKRRKFQKQIRYASRKAYAEVRPRVKGRFAKAADANSTSNQLDMGWFHP